MENHKDRKHGGDIKASDSVPNKVYIKSKSYLLGAALGLHFLSLFLQLSLILWVSLQWHGVGGTKPKLFLPKIE